jgi:hypothetical protein
MASSSVIVRPAAPDYPRSQTLVRIATAANMRPKKKIGNFFAYALVFEKQLTAA